MTIENEKRLLISHQGSDRATAYHMSTKFAAHDSDLWFTWQANPFQIRLSKINVNDWRIESETAVAQTFDNHCGASLAMEKTGRLHVLAGAHQQSFVHRFSDTPGDANAWSLPEAVGRVATYPSTAISKDGQYLHLAYRSSREPWTLECIRCDLTQRPPLWSHWGRGRPILRATGPGYCFWTNSLVIDDAGVLHLLAEFFKLDDKAIGGNSPCVTHLYSSDDGQTWHHTDGRTLTAMPAGLEHVTPILFKGGGDLRPSAMAVLRDGTLATFIFDARNDRVLFCSRPGSIASNAPWVVSDWTAPLKQSLPQGWVFNSQPAFTQDARGSMHVCIVAAPKKQFGHPQSRIFYLRTSADRLEPGPLSMLDPWRDDQPDWLVNMHALTLPDGSMGCLIAHQSGGRAARHVNDMTTHVVLRLLH